MRRMLPLFCAVAWLFVAPLTGSAQDKTKKRPNIIIILADDMGYADAGFQGCKDIPTPDPRWVCPLIR